MFVTLRDGPYLLWRAIDEHGAELDILLQKRREGGRQTLLRARASFVSGATQNRH
jgi:transposase-like protein